MNKGNKLTAIGLVKREATRSDRSSYSYTTVYTLSEHLAYNQTIRTRMAVALRHSKCANALSESKAHSLIELVHSIILGLVISPWFNVSWITAPVYCGIWNEAVYTANGHVEDEVELE